MDTSKTYIEMCDCPEIQEHRMDRSHSTFSHHYHKKGDWFCYTDPNSTVIRMTGDDSPDEPVKGIYIVGDGTVQSTHIPDKEEFFSFIGGYKRVINKIWLPRQDQLQEMTGLLQWKLNAEFVHFLFAVVHLNSWKVSDGLLQFTSMEQLWLAFVMKEKYNKVWDGEEWAERL